jgi:hypothetical protein
MNGMNQSSVAEKIIEQLKKDYAAELTLQTGQKRRRFSASFKYRLFAEANSNHISNKILAKSLGIGRTTLYDWKRQLNQRVNRSHFKKKDLFRKLEIEAEPSFNQGQAPYLEGKLGVRVMGLSLIQMAELLRSL